LRQKRAVGGWALGSRIGLRQGLGIRIPLSLRRLKGPWLHSSVSTTVSSGCSIQRIGATALLVTMKRLHYFARTRASERTRDMPQWMAAGWSLVLLLSTPLSERQLRVRWQGSRRLGLLVLLLNTPLSVRPLRARSQGGRILRVLCIRPARCSRRGIGVMARSCTAYGLLVVARTTAGTIVCILVWRRWIERGRRVPRGGDL